MPDQPGAERFDLPQAMRDEIIAHARAEAPRECCGVIVGPPGDLRELHRLTNTYQGIDFYEPDAAELYRVYMEADARGWDIQVIYHSHPVSPAYPSPRDVQHAGWPSAVYVICSLEHSEHPRLRAFRIVDEKITELFLSAQ
ncbi:MAG TPA: M67 family metallopeptidase [Thermomicrobiales bacterium]|nr:M67 family metallopeptidase [Thermomicrobiales bacterium]